MIHSPAQQTDSMKAQDLMCPAECKQYFFVWSTEPGNFQCWVKFIGKKVKSVIRILLGRLSWFLCVGSDLRERVGSYQSSLSPYVLVTSGRSPGSFVLVASCWRVCPLYTQSCQLTAARISLATYLFCRASPLTCIRSSATVTFLFSSFKSPRFHFHFLHRLK